MHPHLEDKKNKGCYEVIFNLQQCHDRGFLVKASGMCNDLKRKVNLCLRAERLERTRRNHEAAKEKREKIVSVWKEIDEQS